LTGLARRVTSSSRNGLYNGVKFSYLSTDPDLGVITEIFDWPPGLRQEPDAVDPPPDPEL
jgi:hypothetical protein